MYLLVGLGNIGNEYELTRHNFGFLLLDALIEKYALNLHSKKFKSEIFLGEIDQKKIVAIKPQTFMNLSGHAVAQVMNFYKIPLANVIVMHDEIDLELGKIKLKIGGGSAGHNGIKSIDEMVGREYLRLRLGILNNEKPVRQEVSDYVLGRFTRDEMGVVDQVNQKITKLFPELLDGKLESFSNKFYL